LDESVTPVVRRDDVLGWFTIDAPERVAVMAVIHALDTHPP
jgi:hypothetical protein